jgi:crotonobetainyl-CoA:carnitine CoA-transferase CaiB-like acyl-CoA transferase
MVVEVEHAKPGPIRTLRLPVKFSDTPGKIGTGVPVYGQHPAKCSTPGASPPAKIDALLAEGALAITDAS